MWTLIAIAFAGRACGDTPCEELRVERVAKLDVMQCRTAEGLQLSRDGATWSLQNADRQHLASQDPYRLEMKATTEAWRSQRPGDVWRWEARVRVLAPDGDLAELWNGATVDTKLHCVDTSSKTHRWVDVEADFHGVPGAGSTRCRSLDGRWVYVASDYLGGPVPPPEMPLHQAYLADRELVVAREAASMVSPDRVLTIARGPERAPKTGPEHSVRFRQELTFRRADGGLLADLAEVKATFDCERGDFRPRP